MHTAGWLANGLFQKNLREAVLRAISSTRFKAAASAASASASGAGPGFIKLLDMLNAAKSRHHKNFNDQGLRSGGDKAFFEKLQEIRRGLRKEVRKAGIDLYDLTGVPCKLVCTNEKSPNKFTSWDLEQVATPQAAAEVSGAAAEPQQRDVFMQLLIGFGLDPDSTQQTNVEHLVRLAFGFAPDADLTPFLRALFVALKDVAKDSFISSQNKPAVVAAGLAEFGSTAAAAFEGMVGVDNEMAAAAAKKPAEPGPAAPAQAVIDNEAEEGCDDGDFDAAAAARKPAESGPAAPSGAALFTLPAEGVAYEAGKALTAFLNSYTSATKGE